MRYIIIFTFLSFSIAAHAQTGTSAAKGSKKKETHTGNAGKVSGHIKNMPDQTLIVLEMLRANDEVVLVDSSHSDATGRFELNVPAKEPQLYRLRFSASRAVFLSLNKEKMTLEGDWNDADHYTVTGSRASEEVIKFITGFREKMVSFNTRKASIDSLRRLGKDSEVAIAGKQFDDEKANFTESAKETALKTPYEPCAVLAVRVLNTGIDADFLTTFNKSLDKRFPGAAVTKDFHEYYEKSTKVSKAPQVGDMAPEVALSAPDGKTVPLSSLRGQYVLIDFWASWCGPCRGENPNVVAAFNKFKNKNFTIYGVSLDNNKDAWQKAINTDGLTWTQVSELKGWSSAVAGTYGIKSIPQNFLVDPSGKIVAHNLRGPELMTALESTLK